MEASSRSHTKAFNFVFYCTIALCGQNSRAAEPKNRRYDLILFCAMFPFSCTSVIKSRSEAHTCVPVGNARHANCYTAFTFRASRAETRSHTRTYSQWVWVWLRGYLPALWSQHASLFWSLSPTNFHLPRLVAFCQHFFIKAVHRNWELDQEAQRDLSPHWSHAELSWSEAPFISLSAGCRSIETLRSYQPHRRVVYLLV